MDARTCAGSGRSRRSSGRARAGGPGRRTCSRRRRRPAASRSRRQRGRLAGTTPCRSPWSNRSRSQGTDAWRISRCRMRSIGCRIEPRAARSTGSLRLGRLISRRSSGMVRRWCWQTCGVDVLGRVAGRTRQELKVVVLLVPHTSQGLAEAALFCPPLPAMAGKDFL